MAEEFSLSCREDVIRDQRVLRKLQRSLTAHAESSGQLYPPGGTKTVRFSNTGEEQGLGFLMMEPTSVVLWSVAREGQFLCMCMACWPADVSFLGCFCLLCSPWPDHRGKSRLGDWLAWQEKNRAHLLGWASLRSVKPRGREQ